MPQSHDPHIKELTPTDAAEKFEEKMHDISLKQREVDTQKFSAKIQIPYIALVGIPIPPGPLGVITEEEAITYKAVCFAESTEEKKIAIIDPGLPGLEEFLHSVEERTKAKLSLFVMSQTSFTAVLRLYNQLPKLKEEVSGVKVTQEDIDKFKEGFSDIRKVQEQMSCISLTETMTLLVAIALNARASDIHIEAEQHDIKARLRIDGILQDVFTLSPDAWPKIISRVKLISGLKLNVTDRPQDGRFTIYLKDDEVDVRVSTLPTAYGESVVMRLLRSTAGSLEFETLGLVGYNFELLKKEIEKPNGMIITTGPTGSGKTTTMYAILKHLNSPESKIITLEDPVEYKMAGINQSQIDPSRNYTFANGLRSILRQDPDIVMVGEIRDLETADIAINAALTGHLVLSTIHTNSAAGAIPRFLAMGVKQYLLSPALNAIMGQRLVRKLCVECKKETPLEQKILERVKKELSNLTPTCGRTVELEKMKFWESAGCDACHGLGFKGRIGIHEIMGMNAEIEQQILSGQVSEFIIQDIAIKNGMITMVQDGILMALDGVTSVAEVFSVAD